MNSVWSCPVLGSARSYLIIGAQVPRSGREHIAALLDEECLIVCTTHRRTRRLGPHRLGMIAAVTGAAETLPVEDRALLASGLLASLDSDSVDDAEVDRLWSAETERRATLLASGGAELVTWEHLVSRIDERRA